MEELRFTEEEIDHGVRALLGAANSAETLAATMPAIVDAVRAVLRAVRAVPARYLNGGLAGVPERLGSQVSGFGLAGVQVRGAVMWSFPVTTALRTPEGEEVYVWTNTLRSWDPSTDNEVIIGPPSIGKMVPTPRTLAGSPLGTLNGKIWLSALESDHLRADDDGMPCEEGR